MATIEVGAAELPDRFNVTCLAGEPFVLTVPVLDGDSAPIDAVDLASARVQFRPFVDSDLILFEFSTENDPPDAVISGGATGAVVCTADSATTSEWQTLFPGRDGTSVVWWDCEVTDLGDEAHQIVLPGTLTLIHQVTR